MIFKKRDRETVKEKVSPGFGLTSSCILQDLQVGGGELKPVALGSKQTSFTFHAFAEELVVFEVSSIQSKREGKEANWYRESWDRESSKGRRMSHRSLKPLSCNCACLGLQRADDSSFAFFWRAHSTFALHNPSHCAFSIIWGEILSMHFKS